MNVGKYIPVPWMLGETMQMMNLDGFFPCFQRLTCWIVMGSVLKGWDFVGTYVIWEYQKLVGTYVIFLDFYPKDTNEASGFWKIIWGDIAVVEMAWKLFPSENGLWEPYHGSFQEICQALGRNRWECPLGREKLDPFSGFFWSNYTWMSCWKLGSMVRITGLQTPRNTPFIIRWNKPIDLPFTNFQWDIQVIVIFSQEVMVHGLGLFEFFISNVWMFY